MSRSTRIVVVGASGAVGREVLNVLQERGLRTADIVATASEQSAGIRIPFGDEQIRIDPLNAEVFRGACLAIFAASSAVSERFVPDALRAGAWVVDNSSAFRLHDDVPLIVPEINGHLLAGFANRPTLVANPNCSTIILLVAVGWLRRAFGLEAIEVATYQAVSGAGLAAMDELRTQSRAFLAGGRASPTVFGEPCAFNVFSHDSAVDESDGINGEERKIIQESRRILEDPRLRITPTCVRVPVFRAHSMAITVTLSRAAREDEVRAALCGAPGVTLVDNRSANRFPTPAKASGQDQVLVGRIRRDPGETTLADGRARRWCLFASADQLRKGAATNAVQIAELVGAVPRCVQPPAYSATAGRRETLPESALVPCRPG